MSGESKPSLSETRNRRLRALRNIIARQSRNFRVMLAWHAAGGVLGGLAGSYLGMYPYVLGATVTEVGYLTSVNTLSACLPALIGGAMARKYGRKRLVLAIWPSYVGFYLLSMIAPTWLFLVPAYLVYAVAYAGDPALGSLYADALDEETRAEALSIDSTLSGIFALLMPPLGGFLIEYLGGIDKPDGLRTFYGCYAVFHAATMVYFWRRLQDDGSYQRNIGLGDSLHSLHWIFTEGRIERYLAFTVLSSLTAGLSAPFVTIYVFSEMGAPPTFIGLMAAVSTGLTYLMLNIGALWSDRVGRKAPVAFGYLLSACALAALALADSIAGLPLYYLLGALAAIGSAASSALVQEYVPSDLRSQYFGANEALTLICLSVGPLLGGAVYAGFGAKILFVTQAFLQCFVILPYFLLAVQETRRRARTPAHLLRRPRLPAWLTLHPKTHH